jgi:fermentation-respiration switch protein FrsA (DUF1100 family)
VNVRPFMAGVLLAAMTLSSGCAAVGADSSFKVSAAIATPLVTPLPFVSAEDLAARGGIKSTAKWTPADEVTADVFSVAESAIYLSVSGVTGTSTQVGGAFFLPPGTPPPGGWPVIAWAHGTIGITNGCAPSATSDLRGDVAMVASYVSAGFAVAVTDYEGLGDEGRHPYLEPRTAAYNVIDSVRALRNLFPSVGTRWVAIGPSQGGQAAWAVNELDGSYGSGLELLGSVALSPAVELSDLAERATRRTLTSAQFAFMPLIVVGMSTYDPTVRVERLLRGQAAAVQGVLIGCGDDQATVRAGVTDVDNVGPIGIHDENDFRDALRRIALPRGTLAAPMLVINGLRDEAVLPEWITVAVKRSCRAGGVIEHIEVPEAGHNDVGNGGLIAKWVKDRFSGAPASSTCESA